MTEEPQVRKRDAAATKAALLDAAAALFAERGFDRTTVRDIAKLAGANQALLFRYFGSKDALFEEVLARGGREQIATTPPDELLGTALRSMLESDTGRDRTLDAYLRSTGHDSAAGAVRRQLGEEYAKVLATLTDADDADLRADLILAWLLGIGLVREITGKEPLASADPDDVCRLVLGAARTLLERSG
ncbi:TetR/AcrR family transcriptional regulator [Amycolatopsis sp. BJA-103]|uniref:TetR/AcrR family transcriptional regulator n=1 Tax=unclassified Amycolatopsis TaxID=2618356 RepID=UPI000C75F321|nr:TetR/AcrR family transcriptional regulator [Amycolatopsis sp. BJA-103]AUI56894.1 TetR family transcriptional regulator [Amycolatopsis sp. BJA-103]PNE13428.1 TetR family transcriptional regulator [Amycolatopsis sp. BJA-103]